MSAARWGGASQRSQMGGRPAGDAGAAGGTAGASASWHPALYLAIALGVGLTFTLPFLFSPYPPNPYIGLWILNQPSAIMHAVGYGLASLLRSRFNICFLRLDDRLCRFGHFRSLGVLCGDKRNTELFDAH